MNALDIITELRRYHVVPRLDKGQLRLAGEVANLPQDFIEMIRSRKQELIAFLDNSSDTQAYAPIPLVAAAESYPASNAQHRLWLLSQFEGGSEAYNIVTALHLQGQVSITQLENAFHWCIQRHESLRTVFREIDGVPKQIVMPDMPFSIAFQDISEHTDQVEFLRTSAANAAAKAFDLSRGPLIDVQLFALSADEYAMIFSVHHIISDGWSVGVLIQEVMRAYEVGCRNQSDTTAPLRIQYKDYVHWLQEKIAGPKGRKAKDFWMHALADQPEPLQLPTDFSRPAIRSFDGAISKNYFPATLYTKLTQCCKQHQITPFNFLRGVLSILLYKLSGQEVFLIGTPVSGRNHYELEHQMGLYVNTLPLKAVIDPAASFMQLLQQHTNNLFQAFEYQDYPLDNIIEDLQVKRDTARNPLFDVMMVLQNTAVGDGAVNFTKQYGFEMSMLDRKLPVTVASRSAKFDLTFNFGNEPGGEFYIEIEYATKLFTAGRIEAFRNIYLHLLEQALENVDRSIRDFTTVDDTLQHQLLHVFNEPVTSVAIDSIPALIAPSFVTYADKTAIIAGDRSLTYAELDRLSDKGATYLRTLLNSPGQFTGLLMERSEWTIIAILSILKAGAAYVPIDTKYPAGRIKYILDDAQPSLLLVDDHGAKLVPEDFQGHVININDWKSIQNGHLPASAATASLSESTAYLIYTSGSTGQPKGVEICHRNTVAFLDWARTEFADTPYDIIYATTSYCFDLSVFEFFFPLLSGKTIRMMSSALEISSYLDIDRNIMINTVPAVVKALLEEKVSWEHVTALNMAGEQVPKRLKDDLDYTRIEVRNLYGPSEDTTYSTMYRFSDVKYSQIPIGKPVGYTQLYILDKDGQLLPPGIEGEIYLSGQSVAKGYYNRLELTATRFLPNPFVPGLTMYKTGDAGLWLPDGNVLFTGRKDDQVKVRGFRIEPGEIQYLLEIHPAIERAVVNVTTIAGENAIVAYWTGTDEVTPASLKSYLAQHLPAYMLPDYFMQLQEIPLNSNGKVDKKQLPLPDASVVNIEVVPPTSRWQQELWKIWNEVLQTENFGITHNFFELGGHSLKAARLRYLVLHQLKRNISLDEIFLYPTIESQAAIIETRAVSESVHIPLAATQPYYPISFSQERLWVLTKFEEASSAYHMPAAFRIDGVLDRPLLEAAFRQVIGRYEILRTVFTEKNGQPVQLILAPEDMPFAIEDITLSKSLSEIEEQEFLQQQWQRPFDLKNGPLLRCFVLETPAGRILSFNMHHIISDGYSIVVLYKNIVETYRRLQAGRSNLLPAPALQFKDFAAWQREQLTGDKLQEQLDFWQEIFSEEVPTLELPTDFHRPDVKTYQGSSSRFFLHKSISSQLITLSKKSGVSLFMTLTAAINILLSKYTGQRDIVVGTPAAGRGEPQLQDQIGFFVNTLAIRSNIDPQATFADFLLQERDQLLRAFEYQSFPFELLIDALQLKRNLSRSPLFDVMIVLQNIDGLNREDMREIAPGLRFDPLMLSGGTAKYDLTFTFAEEQEGLVLELEYNTNLFKQETIGRMYQHLNKLFEQVVATPEMIIRDITLLDNKELEILRSKADQTAIGYDRTKTIVDLFHEAAVKYPDNTALVVGDKKLSYRELDIRSGQLARCLVADYGVQPEQLVVLHFSRNEWMIISILAVLKAGAAYVPVDPTYPAARIDYIMEDSGATLVLSDDGPCHIADNWSAATVVDITQLNMEGNTYSTAIRPEQLAYVIYTSGTTGNPKGVMIEHRNVNRLLFNEGNLFTFNENDRWSLFHSYCFDFSVWEMYGALLYGAALVMVPKEVAQDSLAFYDFILEEGVTVLNQTPTAFRSFVQHNQQRFIQSPLPVRYLIFGGEALMPDILRSWNAAMPYCHIINMYGITETTVHVTYKEITEEDIAAGKSNIGVPIPTLSCYVLDAALQQVPIGVVGELCVGGAGVARGYLNKAALTAERFVADPLNSEGRLYRSGDYARILPSGDLEYIGRKDDQVKIRGHRIELAEVATAITRQEGVKDAVVIPRKHTNGEHELVAYFIPVNGLLPHELRASLSEELPIYMVPSYIIALDDFPVNSNGKLDKDALPQPDTDTARHTVFVPYRNELDKHISAIWEEVLERPNIGIRDNFFDLGGHSLKATRVISRINEAYGVKVDLKHLFTDPTVEHLSNYIETVRWMETQEQVPAENQDELIF
ncbi:amino acid adenylation domain-containing protein [Chitinophaga sp. Hz27]|uniref:amino acid adenylation domain-containing protein n=1 Tax=Chitinophaga sp. Hz27 TaxID=3347169 RepID=UPI0035E00EE5